MTDTRYRRLALSLSLLSLLATGCQCSEPPREEGKDAAEVDSSTSEDARDSASPEVVDLNDEVDSRGDGDADADEVEAASWWSDIENRCAPSEPKVPAERYRPGKAPVVEGEMPRVLWQNDALCPDLGGFDAYGEGDAYIYGGGN